MSDDFVFAQLPYAAIAGGLIAALVSRRLMTSIAPDATARGSAFARLATAAMCVVLVQHLVLLLAPAAVLRWNRDPLRLLMLEGGGAAAGLVWAAAALARLWRHLFHRTTDAPSVQRTLTLTLGAIAVVSGLVTALGYRWASSWSVVTLTPYVVSLARLTPRVDLVVATPFAVRLHLVGGCALLAAFPLTTVGSAALAATSLAIRTAALRSARALKAIGGRIDLGSIRVLRPQSIWPEEES
jgi:nitrate reductase gamma subunit